MQNLRRRCEMLCIAGRGVVLVLFFNIIIITYQSIPSPVSASPRKERQETRPFLAELWSDTGKAFELGVAVVTKSHGIIPFL